MSDQFYHSKETVKEYIKMAEGYDGLGIIEKLRKFLRVNSTVLEIGTGPGKDLKILSKYYQVTGSDFSAVFLKLLKEKLPHIPLLHLNAITLKTDKTFDGIYSNKVLHHLANIELEESIKNQHRILNKNGIVCHSFWEGDKIEKMHGLLHNYYRKNKIEQLFSDQFEIVLLKRYTEIEKNDSILMIGKKH